MHQIKDHKIANTVAVKSIYYNDDNLTTTAFDVSIKLTLKLWLLVYIVQSYKM